MDIKSVVLDIAEDILGLDRVELLENMDMDLREAGLIDSVGIASMFTFIEDRIGKEIDTRKLSFDDFSSLNSITSAISDAID